MDGNRFAIGSKKFDLYQLSTTIRNRLHAFVILTRFNYIVIADSVSLTNSCTKLTDEVQTSHNMLTDRQLEIDKSLVKEFAPSQSDPRVAAYIPGAKYAHFEALKREIP